MLEKSPALDNGSAISGLPTGLAKSELAKLKPVLRSTAGIEYDAFVFGVGERSPSGSVRITRYTCDGLEKDELVRMYSSLADYDVVGQLFSATAGRSVLAVPVGTFYPKEGSRQGSAPMGAALRAAKIAHLLLVGVDTSRGLAWLTLYRKTGAAIVAFSADDCERADYEVRAAIYAWQRHVGLAAAELPIERYEALALTPRQLQTALRLARGWTAPDIAKALGVEKSTVQNHVAAVQSLLGNKAQIADRLLGTLPKAR